MKLSLKFLNLRIFYENDLNTSFYKKVKFITIQILLIYFLNKHGKLKIGFSLGIDCFFDYFG